MDGSIQQLTINLLNRMLLSFMRLHIGQSKHWISLSMRIACGDVEEGGGGGGGHVHVQDGRGSGTDNPVHYLRPVAVDDVKNAGGSCPFISSDPPATTTHGGGQAASCPISRRKSLDEILESTAISHEGPVITSARSSSVIVAGPQG